MSEWLEWLRQSDLIEGYAPGNVCFVFSSGPITVNPSPHVDYLTTDSGDVLNTDGGAPLTT